MVAQKAGMTALISKFLLGLRQQGLHVSYALSAAAPRPGDESSQARPSSRAYPGMLGEQL